MHCLLPAAFHANSSANGRLPGETRLPGCHAEWKRESSVAARRPSCPTFIFSSLFYTYALSILSAMPSKIHYPLTLLYLSVSLLLAANPPSSPLPPENDHKCYFIDGSYDPAGGPCYENVGASMCCYTGEGCAYGSGLCLASPNGPVGPHDNGSSIWRRSCTDVTWQDLACLAVAYGRVHLSPRACVLEHVARSVANSVVHT